MTNGDQPDQVEGEIAAADAEPPRVPAKNAPAKKRVARKKGAKKKAGRKG